MSEETDEAVAGKARVMFGYTVARDLGCDVKFGLRSMRSHPFFQP